MNQVTEHDDMLAGMHPLVDVCGKKDLGFRGAQRVPGFYRASAYRGFRGFRICWRDKVYLQVYTESQRSAPNLPR